MPLGTVVAFVSVLKRLYGPASAAGRRPRRSADELRLLRSHLRGDGSHAVHPQCPEPGARRSPIAGDIEFTQRLAGLRRCRPRHLGRFAEDSRRTHHRPGRPVGLGQELAGLAGHAALRPDRPGSVAIDGVDVRQLDWRRSASTLASSRRTRSCCTRAILDNLRYAKPSATRAEIEDAARQAQIHDTIVPACRSGYDTMVGERGYRLSGANVNGWRLPAPFSRTRAS